MTENDSIKVLVVEDELVAATYIKHKLHELGYEITATVPTGEQALIEIEKNTPDIILMDIVLEGKLDGIDTANIIRKQSGIPVLYLTSYTDEQKIQRALESSPYGYILKPIQERELHANIKMSLYKSQLEKQLKKSEIRSRTILENAPLAIVCSNLDFSIEFANERFYQLFGMEFAEASVNGTILQYLFPDTEQQRTVLHALQTEEKISGIISKVAGREGKAALLRISASKYRASTEGYEFFIEDMTEKEQLEKEAKISESKFNTLFKSPTIPYMLIDDRFIVELYNEATMNMIQELTGLQLVSGTDLEQYLDGIKSIAHEALTGLKAGESFIIDYQLNVGQKPNRWLEISFSKINQSETSLTEYTVYLREITERKNYEMELQEYIKKLELQQNRLEEQSVELYYLNEKLLYSEHNLKQLNANKDKFFSIIAHDLRSPFNNLLGFSEYLLEDFDLLDKETIRSISIDLNKSIKHVFELLNNLLQWSRIQAGRSDFNPERLSLQELIAEVMRLYGPIAAKKMIHLYPEIPEGVELLADKNMMASVLQNLVSNAIKFTRKGGAVHIIYDSSETEHRLRIQDSGIGMSKDIIDRLFKIEENVSRYGTEQEAGTGLGLVLCKEFLEMHGGSIRVQSEEQKGTEFTITLPVKQQQ